jgi:hypothetical protein
MYAVAGGDAGSLVGQLRACGGLHSTDVGF